jgi:hypothetical protein
LKALEFFATLLLSHSDLGESLKQKVVNFGLNALWALLISIVAATVTFVVSHEIENIILGYRYQNFFSYNPLQAVFAFLIVSVWMPLFGIILWAFAYSSLNLIDAYTQSQKRNLRLLILGLVLICGAVNFFLSSPPIPQSMIWYSCGQLIGVVTFAAIRSRLRAYKDSRSSSN